MQIKLTNNSFVHQHAAFHDEKNYSIATRSRTRPTRRATNISRALEHRFLTPTKMEKFKEFQINFDKPLVDAAQFFGIRATAFKKRCRSIGISQWPYRKIKSLKRRREILRQAAAKPRNGHRKAKNINSRIDEVEKQLRTLFKAETYGISSNSTPSNQVEDFDFPVKKYNLPTLHLWDDQPLQYPFLENETSSIETCHSSPESYSDMSEKELENTHDQWSEFLVTISTNFLAPEVKTENNPIFNNGAVKCEQSLDGYPIDFNCTIPPAEYYSNCDIKKMEPKMNQFPLPQGCDEIIISSNFVDPYIPFLEFDSQLDCKQQQSMTTNFLEMDLCSKTLDPGLLGHQNDLFPEIWS